MYSELYICVKSSYIKLIVQHGKQKLLTTFDLFSHYLQNYCIIVQCVLNQSTSILCMKCLIEYELFHSNQVSYIYDVYGACLIKP